jgi:hypothetical protein
MVLLPYYTPLTIAWWFNATGSEFLSDDSLALLLPSYFLLLTRTLFDSIECGYLYDISPGLLPRC